MENRQVVPLNIAYNLFESIKGSIPNLTPIIFLHGIAADKETWGDIPSIIAEKTNRKVYAYDARNFGESEYTDEYSFIMNIDDLFYFMDVVKIQKAILFGHSMGGYSALNAALRKPERVAMVITEDTHTLPRTDATIKFCGEYIKNLSDTIIHIPSIVDKKDVPNIVMDEMYEGLSEKHKAWIPKESLNHIYVPIKRDSKGRYVANYNTEALYKASQSPHKMQIEPHGLYVGPAIFICGTESYIEPFNKPHVRKFFPNAEYVELEGACHNIHARFEKETIEAILSALTKYNVD